MKNKNMKLTYKSVSLFGSLLVAASLFSCGPKQDLKMWEFVDKTQDVTNSGGGSVELPVLQGELMSALGIAIDYEVHAYQYTNTNSVDAFSGYVSACRSTFQYGEPLPHTYSYPNSYIGSGGGTGPTAALYHAYTFAVSLGHPEYKAIAQIVYGMTALRGVNNMGTIAYIDNRNLKVSHPVSFQSQEETYRLILSDLDEAIATLESVKPGKESLIAIEGQGKSTGDVTFAFSNYEWENWVKLANTIKLRIAMCLSKPDNAKARVVAEQALNGLGVLDDDFGPGWLANRYTHPLYFISSSKEGWADCRIGASLENIMKRLNNPLLSKYASKNGGALADKTTGATLLSSGSDYVGIRQGSTMEPKSTGIGYNNFSEIDPNFKYIRPVWVSKEEVLFLKAEAALRWGIGGNAGEYYEKGIRSSFEKYAVTEGVDEYLNRQSIVKLKGNKNIDFIDYYVSSNSCAGRLGIGVKWSDDDDNETKLEKIITQKWIANFPNSYEAWTDFRRTGYPRLLPVPEANKWTGSPTFPVELQLRRIPFSESDDNTLIDLPNIRAALSVFGLPGQNSGGMRLYFEGDPGKYPWEYDEDETSYSYGWFIPKNF
ncbi:MAG: SusD/RagB family nutrient-binding outer membrane lipoprotein [Bacteroidales bacterium]